MIIRTIEKNSIASEIGLQENDILVSINGAAIRDTIDYSFNIVDTEIDVQFKRGSEKLRYIVEKDLYDDLGVAFEEIVYRDCASKCVFCFVDQNPAGMRETLYFRDEDYRMSFMHGSYFTLNNVSRSDLKRMVEQRLSPLYISVHALDRRVRNYLFGVKREDYLLEKIEYLTENGIELHAQIVLCPGINDGKVLEDTISGLAKYYPGVRTVAIVPLGMTKHRNGLAKLNPVTVDYADKFVRYVHKIQKEFLKENDERFAFLSDEWYIKSGRRLPSLKHYGELYQLENGVGMTRQLINTVKKQKKVFEKPLKKNLHVNLISGVLAAPFLSKYLKPIMEAAQGLTVDVHVVNNKFWGETITVSGLLTGGDIVEKIKSLEGDLFVLPPNILNPDMITLDNMSLDDMSQKSGKELLIYSGYLEDIYTKLENL